MDEEIIKAMKVMRDYCMATDCYRCKFNDVSGCGLDVDFTAPCDWKIEDTE